MRQLKTLCVCLVASLLSIGQTSAKIAHPEKIGIAAISRVGSGPVIDQMGFPFYYTWTVKPTNGSETSVFIPMIKRAENLQDPIPAGSRVLLGFNEPYRPDQYMSPDTAVQLWPALIETGLRLGSPATSPGTSTLGPRSWLGEFLSKAKAKNYPVDFIALHYYSADGDIEKFRYYLQKVYETYRKPIWVTEWALYDHKNRAAHPFTTAQTVDFAKRGLEMLDNLPFVERHMWYKTHFTNTTDMRTNILDGNNELTEVGKVFAVALRGGDFGSEVIHVPDNIVPNPSFEDSDDARWQFYWRRNMGVAQVVVSGAHTGMSSMRLGGGAAQVSNDISYRILPGKTYQLSAWVRLTKAEKGVISIRTFNASGGTISNSQLPITATSYTKVQGTFTVPTNADRIVINIYKNVGTGYLFIDDVSVTAN